MLRQSKVVLLLLIILVAGCFPGGVWAEPLNPPARAMTPKRPDEVPILTQKPDRKFREVALLHVQTGLHLKGTMLEALRKRAASMGCDAVVIVNRYESTFHDPIAGTSSKEQNYAASCIQLEASPAASAERAKNEPEAHERGGIGEAAMKDAMRAADSRSEH